MKINAESGEFYDLLTKHKLVMKNYFLHTDLQVPENLGLKIGMIFSETQ